MFFLRTTLLCTESLSLWKLHSYRSFQVSASGMAVVSSCRCLLMKAACTGGNTGKSWGTASQLTFFSWQNLHSEICGKRDKVEELLKHADQCSAAIKVLGFQHFYGVWFFMVRRIPLCLLCWQVKCQLPDVCVCRNSWAEALVCTKYNKSNLSTCYLKTTGWCRRYQWELLFRRIKSFFWPGQTFQFTC